MDEYGCMFLADLIALYYTQIAWWGDHQNNHLALGTFRLYLREIKRLSNYLYPLEIKHDLKKLSFQWFHEKLQWTYMLLFHMGGFQWVAKFDKSHYIFIPLN